MISFDSMLLRNCGFYTHFKVLIFLDASKKMIDKIILIKYKYNGNELKSRKTLNTQCPLTNSTGNARPLPIISSLLP